MQQLKTYQTVQSDIAQLLRSGRLAAVRSVNSVMTATYWAVGQRIVEAEQKGRRRADYGEQLLKQLATDLTAEFGRGFGKRNLHQMCAFYLSWPLEKIVQTLSAQFPWPSSALGTAVTPGSPTLAELARAFPLPWSAYVSLLSVGSEQARDFYEAEALRSGWSVRQLDRQIDSQFYERTALSRNKTAMLSKGAIAKSEDAMTLAEVIKDPYVLEFLDIKDEYSEGELEEALIRRLEDFLLELGDDFAFVGRQKRLRLDDQWFRVDLVFYHRVLRCLVLVDLKLGKFNHSDAGQMHMYRKDPLHSSLRSVISRPRAVCRVAFLTNSRAIGCKKTPCSPSRSARHSLARAMQRPLNYAKAHWMREGENPPVGLILCSQKGDAQAHYALDGLPNKVLAARYQTLLPSAEKMAMELKKADRLIRGKRNRF